MVCRDGDDSFYKFGCSVHSVTLLSLLPEEKEREERGTLVTTCVCDGLGWYPGFTGCRSHKEWPQVRLLSYGALTGPCVPLPGCISRS